MLVATGSSMVLSRLYGSSCGGGAMLPRSDESVERVSGSGWRAMAENFPTIW